MSAKKFKFVSPGVFLNEIDNSQLPKGESAVGPVIIGRTQRGPAFRPTRVESFSDFIDVFGEPAPGFSLEGDQFRTGVPAGPTYAAYAAQAYLRNNGPVTIVRLLGSEHPNKSVAVAASAGYRVGDAGGSCNVTNDAGGAYGLFLFPSSSCASDGLAVDSVTGTLGAIFYATGGAIELTGAVRAHESAEAINVSGTNVAVQDDGNQGFSIVVKSGAEALNSAAGTNAKRFNFNFNPDSDKFIRRVFNTDSTKLNSTITSTDAQETYFLGQTYERSVQHMLDKSPLGTGSRLFGIVLPLQTSAISAANYRMKARESQSGWVVSQDLRNTEGNKSNSSANAINFDPESSHVTKLFKFKGLSEGEWIQRNLKISIERIKASSDNFNKFGTFSVVVRKIEDNDRSPKVVERYDNLNLNPYSPDYIGRRIGDMYEVYDDDRRRLQAYGTYPNNSKFIRVEVANQIDSGQGNAELIPFGFYGPIIYNHFTIATDVPATSANNGNETAKLEAAISGTTILHGNGKTSDFSAGYNGSYGESGSVGAVQGVFVRANVADQTNQQAHLDIDAKFEFPSHRLVADSTEFGLNDHRSIYFGIDTTKSGTSNLAFDSSNVDLAHPLASGIADDFEASNTTTTSYVFTLDNISGSSNSTNAEKSVYDRFYYVSGSRAAGESITAATGSYKAVLLAFKDTGGARFTLPLFGGFNGFDTTEKEPFNHHTQLASSATEQTSYGYYSVKKAMDIIADPEFAEMNLAVAPGVTNENLTSHLVNICEERGDALAIIDPAGGYTPSTDASTSEQARTTSTAARDVATSMAARNINSSYGAAYFPWVQIRDSIKGNLLYVPPSVVALGVLGASEAKSAVWFAPAGFNRGGLNENAAGLSVTGVRHKLTSGERDRLYETNINPIASFPSEGIVVFGQKTLQVTPSALDRINVRRLMIYVKRGLSRISNTTLFDQNLPATWTRFKTRADNFLGGVKAGLGLQDYRIILDETTTTPDLVDRNIMYAKIFIKPARAIEFIALDFVITRSGASFDD